MGEMGGKSDDGFGMVEVDSAIDTSGPSSSAPPQQASHRRERIEAAKPSA